MKAVQKSFRRWICLEIRIADKAGFCFGVDRAVKLVYESLEKGCTVTLGEIIHNPDVVSDLSVRGVRVVEAVDQIRDGETAVIRSHGVSAQVCRQLEDRGISYIDGTCPYVKRIHNIVREKSESGYIVVIMGDSEHPEVQGIAGNCINEPVIIADDRGLTEFLKKNNGNSQKRLAFVAQTTYNINMWSVCKKLIAEYIGDCEIYDTICSATNDRQNEAAELAARSDIMIVAGGKNSSNTRKLYDICKRVCPKSFLVENASELNMIEMLKGFSDISNVRIGITAGASTPAHIIKEVKNQMSEKLQNMDEDFNFEEAIDASFKRLYTGNRVKGYITAVNNTEAIVDIGTKQTGYVSLDELTDDPSLKPADVVKVGDEVEFIVLKVNDAEGYINLSKKKVDAMVGFDKIVKAKDEDAVLEGVVMSVVKGGVLASTNGVKVFIPASQATMRRDEKLEELVKKTVNFKIIEVNEQKGKAVGSIKEVLKAEREAAKAKFWESVQVGDKFKGEVKSITDYGVFVDLGGIDGMVHISELSWNRIKHPSEVVAVGDVLEVYVKDLDKDANRISLGYKKDEDNPIVKFENEYNEGDVVKVKIVSITPFGAFAQIIPGIDGLIHISQIADKRVTNVKDVLSIGDEVDAKITEIDSEKKRISLSIRALLEENAAESDAE
ncbi:MAG: bifunctional 4-hydroxy-3-methylbut-2-enyl diphosphate reductase/30S ribosomal protein S1 [Oscillospiraceae bacterium]|nr:bifunctional 4-hydroxy-3-methylbut-2-enyl diphosphate reductase/30S ribosomal protein S1 [Oscillospiraceae bacterium]